MTARKQQAASAVTVAVWLAVLGFAAALTYRLNPREHWTSGASELAAPASATCVAQAETVSEAPSVLSIPTVTIFGQAPHHPAVAPAPKAP
jgi:hypothetical protein